jgi:hypothetical protein
MNELSKCEQCDNSDLKSVFVSRISMIEFSRISSSKTISEFYSEFLMFNNLMRKLI